MFNSITVRTPITIYFEFEFTIQLSELPRLRWLAVGQEAWPNFLDAPNVPYFRKEDLRWFVEQYPTSHLTRLINDAGGVENLEVIANTYADDESPFGHHIVVVPKADDIVYWRSNSGRSELRTVGWSGEIVTLRFYGTLSALRRLRLPLVVIE